MLFIFGIYFFFLYRQKPSYRSRAEVVITELLQPDYEGIIKVRYSRKTLIELFKDEEWRNEAARILRASELQNTSVPELFDRVSGQDKKQWRDITLDKIYRILEQHDDPLLDKGKKLREKAALFQRIQLRQRNENEQLYEITYVGKQSQKSRRIVNAFLASAVLKSREEARSQYQFLANRLQEKKQNFEQKIHKQKNEKSRIILSFRLHNQEYHEAAAMIFRASEITHRSVKSLFTIKNPDGSRKWKDVSLTQIREILSRHNDDFIREKSVRRKKKALFEQIKLEQDPEKNKTYTVHYTGDKATKNNKIIKSFIAAVILKSHENRRSGLSFQERSLFENNKLILQEKLNQQRILEKLTSKLETYQTELQQIRPIIQSTKIKKLKNDYLQKLMLQSISGGPFSSGDAMFLTDSPRKEPGSLKQKLNQKRTLLQSELETKTPAHPRVKELKAEVQSLEEQLEKSQSSQLTNSLRRHTAKQRKMQLEMSEYSRRENELMRKIEDLNQPVSELEEREDQIASMQTQLQKINNDLTNIRQRKQTQLGPVEAKNWSKQAVRLQKKLPMSPMTVALIAVLTGVGLAYFRDYLDDTIRTDYDVRRYLNLPILALVREEEQSEDVLIKNHPLKAPISEVYNTGATLLQSSMKESGGLNIISFTSAVPLEGKTSMSLNVATAFARKGLRTCLVDLDLRGARIHSHLDVPRSPGMSNYLGKTLKEDRSIEEAKNLFRNDMDEIITPTDIDHLHTAPAGRSKESPIRLLESPYLRPLLETFSEEYDIVLCDTPPIKSVSDPLIISQAVDGTVLVVGVGLVTKQDASWTKHLLNNVRAHLLGVIMNRYQRQQTSEYYYYYSYDYKGYRPNE